MKQIPDSSIQQVAKHINERNNKNYFIPIVGNRQNPETPQYFEIIDFGMIDDSDRKFYAVDGSSNSQEFYNGLYIGIYSGGYICYQRGKQLRMNTSNDPIFLGKSYFPQNILVSNEQEKFSIYEELLALEPVKNLLEFFTDGPEHVFAHTKDTICSSVSKLLDFCQEILEWSLIFEVANRPEIQRGDFILKDGSLRSLQIKQNYLVKLGEELHKKGIFVVGITKRSAAKMELSYTFRQIDNYLQDQYKHEFPFKNPNPQRRKIGCWFEVPEMVLRNAYGEMYAKKGVQGGRGFGLFFAARLDYVEKLQNYDWVIADVNIFDAIREGQQIDGKSERNMEKLGEIFMELTRLTQEHYILGYPYPLVEAHNLVSLKKDFKEEVINRVKLALYQDQRMDNVDIENLFVDEHERF
jgi:hypothetical protein